VLSYSRQSYLMPDIQKVFGISRAELRQLVRARLLPEFDGEGSPPKIYCTRVDGGRSGGRRWTALGVLRLFVTLYLKGIGLERRPMSQAIGMVFEGATSKDSERPPESIKEIERLIKQRFIARPGERKYIVISLGNIFELGKVREFTATAEVVTQATGEAAPGEPGELVIPLAWAIGRIRELLAAAGLPAADFSLDDGDE